MPNNRNRATVTWCELRRRFRLASNPLHIAVSAAQSAARAGARELDLAHLRAAGQIRLDPVQAHNAAQRWLEDAGLPGTVNVAGDEVTVTLTTARDTQLLQLVGISTIPVGASATATAIPPG